MYRFIHRVLRVHPSIHPTENRRPVHPEWTSLRLFDPSNGFDCGQNLSFTFLVLYTTLINIFIPIKISKLWLKFVEIGFLKFKNPRQYFISVDQKLDRTMIENVYIFWFNWAIWLILKNLCENREKRVVYFSSVYGISNSLKLQKIDQFNLFGALKIWIGDWMSIVILVTVFIKTWILI